MLADRYELDHEIGRGGMGAVWLAHDTVLGRTVAIKQIGMAPGGGAPDLERAEREAHLAARLNHHNVVAVFDLVDHDGHQWLVMEHVAGPTLAGLVKERGPIDPEELAPVVEQVAGALAAAHAHGIVHRDVKPSNILLTSDGIAKLSDFGIARAQADASLTQTGMVTGSPAYLSPEVATGRPATPASDVWSLGATVFHALAGHAPYEVGDNVLGAMYRIVHEEPPRLDDGGRLAPLVEAMMQQDPETRPTMAEVERAVADGAALVAQSDVVAAPHHLDLDATQEFPGPAADRPAPVEPPEPVAATAFQPLAAPVPRPVPPPPAPPTSSEPTSRGNRPLWLGGVAAAAVLVILAFAIGSRGGTNDPAADSGPSGTGSVQPTTPAADDPPAADGLTAEQLEGFAGDYLTAASNDPREGFTLLTPAYQQESGGLDGYENFWSRVSNLDVETVRGDPEALTVSYTYSYDFGDDDDRRTENVTLQLEQAGDGFLISGAT